MSKLKISPNSHVKANISNINFLKNKVFIPFLSLAVSISFFSGCKKNDGYEVGDYCDYTITNDTERNEIDNSLVFEEEVSETINNDVSITEPVVEPTEVVDIVDENGVVAIPDSYKNYITKKCSKEYGDNITIEDLAKIDELSFYVFDNNSDFDDNLSWLQYCTNLKHLDVVIKSNNIENINKIKYIPNLASLELDFYHYDDYIDISFKNFGFLKDMTSITKLNISGWRFNVEPGLLESLNNLRDLSITFEYDHNIDFSKLTFLDSLYLGGEPYSVVCSLDMNDYNILVNNNVKIKFTTNEDFNKFYDANKKLDEIISSFNLDENASDQEKLDAILIYVLDNLEYDKEVARCIKEKIEHKKLTKSFYIDGALHAFFEKDSAICGTYSALVDALANRLNLKSFIARSDNHAWNIVNVEGENYYVDATWLDGKWHYDEITEKIDGGYSTSWIPVLPQQVIKRGDGELLEWYLKDPTKSDSSVGIESHDIINLPSYITIKPIEKEETKTTEPTDTNIINNQQNNDNHQNIEDITNKKFEISINNKVWIISGATLIGILSGLGVAVKVKKDRKRKQEQERRKRQNNNYGYTYNYSYSSYNSNSFRTDNNTYNSTSNRSRRGF